jgi:hypothetical protein
MLGCALHFSTAGTTRPALHFSTGVHRHRQVRDESRIKGLKYDVRPQFPADMLGVHVLLPSGTAGQA